MVLVREDRGGVREGRGVVLVWEEGWCLREEGVVL